MDVCSFLTRFILRYVLITFIVTSGFYSKTSSARHKHVSTFVDDRTQNYLMNFGYLPSSNSETGNLRTEEQLTEAIKTFQHFGNIPVTGVIDQATNDLLRTPRCGLPDWPMGYSETQHRKKRFTLQGQTWPHTNLTWSLRSKQIENLDTNFVRRELSRALDVWAQHSKLTFREINSDDADILIYFFKGLHNDGYAFDGKGQILAHAFFPGTGRGGDVHFDEDETWILHDLGENDEGTSLFAVAAHEFGHSLGLSHSSVPGALMYPWYQGTKPDVLPEDDRLGIQQMYGAKENKQWGSIPSKWMTTTTTTTSTTSTTTSTERTRQPNPFHPFNTPQNPPPKYPQYHPREKPGRHNPKQPPYYNPSKNIPPNYPDYPNTIPSGRYPQQWPPSQRPPAYPPRRPYNPDTRPERPERRRPQEDPTRRHHNPYWPTRGSDERPERPREFTTTTTTTTPSTTTTTTTTTTTERPSRRTRPTHRHKHNNRHLKHPPDKCNMSYDAITVIRNEVFIFKNEYLWRIGDNGLYEGYPAEITRMWNDLPPNLSYVDAVYERNDHKIVFFIDKLYYLYNRNRLEKGYPRPLTHLGLPEYVHKIDGAMIWGHNGKTYLYSGDRYWRLDEETERVELDYPRDMGMWGGVGNNIDTVFQWKDGRTYFFKGLGFWKFNDRKMRVENTKASLSAPFWMGCPVVHERFQPSERPLIGYRTNDSSKLKSSANLIVVVFVIILSLNRI